MNNTENHHHNHSNLSPACIVLNITSTNGIWQGENPLFDSFPLLINELAIIIFVTRAIKFVLRPLRQPQIVTDILGGVLLGPSFFAMGPYFSSLFPVATIITLETVAYMALDLYIFLVALEMDIKLIGRASKRELGVAIAIALLPMCTGIGLFFLTARLLHLHIDTVDGCLFWGLTFSVTGFPVVSRILKDFKILHSGIGKMAMTTVMINDICSWILMAIAVPIRFSPNKAPFVVTATAAFILLAIYVVRPALVWVIRRTSEGNNNVYSEYHLCFVLVGVLVCSIITESCGTHSIVGAFVFGIIMPRRELRSQIVERFEDFVSGILLPLFFTICGIRTNLNLVTNWLLVCVIVVLAFFCKILATVLVSLLYNNMSGQERFALGVLMNTKGVLALIILNLGWDKKVLDDQEYTLIVIAIVVMTGMVAPIIASIYEHSDNVQAKGRTIQRQKQGAELRILACVQHVDQVPGMINLLAISNATKQSPIHVFALHILELNSRGSDMLIVHSTRKTGGLVYKRHEKTPSDQIIAAFENLENQNAGISVQPLTALSPFISILDDVCSLAEDKSIAFMIIPFPQQVILNCNNEDANPLFRKVNLNILAKAPCSVGIFVDRGLGAPTLDNCQHRMHHLVIIFIGGPDDREALAYAWRMLGHPLVKLTVVRLFLARQTQYSAHVQSQRQLDAEYINQFRLGTAGERHVSYSEEWVNDAEETIAVLRAMDHRKVDLYIVGREAVETPITAGLLEWSDCPELGAIGDLLVFSDFVTGSVLVVQQFGGAVEDM